MLLIQIIIGHFIVMQVRCVYEVFIVDYVSFSKMLNESRHHENKRTPINPIDSPRLQ